MEISKGKIGNALTSTADNHVVAVAKDIYDEVLGMYQDRINGKLKEFLGLYNGFIKLDGVLEFSELGTASNTYYQKYYAAEQDGLITCVVSVTDGPPDGDLYVWQYTKFTKNSIYILPDNIRVGNYYFENGAYVFDGISLVPIGHNNTLYFGGNAFSTKFDKTLNSSMGANNIASEACVIIDCGGADEDPRWDFDVSDDAGIEREVIVGDGGTVVISSCDCQAASTQEINSVLT